MRPHFKPPWVSVRTWLVHLCLAWVFISVLASAISYVVVPGPTPAGLVVMAAFFYLPYFVAGSNQWIIVAFVLWWLLLAWLALYGAAILWVRFR